MGEGSPEPVGGLLAGFGPGRRVAGYLLEDQLGAGGMAVVFRAVDERLGRQVALKIMAPALAADAAYRKRFSRESRAAAAVDDPHIIPVYEAGEADGVLFIAMRLVPGRDVRTLLAQEETLSPGRVAAIISPVASALDAAHAAGLVHRDVKPGNMLIDARPDRPDHVYLSDFGLSKGASSVGMTGTGMFLGTPSYSAPEQILGHQVDGRADQYALACAAFELLAGQPPFERDQGMAVLLAHLNEPPPSPRALRTELPAKVDDVFALANPDSAGVNAVAFSPDGSMLAVGDENGYVYLWQVTTARLARVMASPESLGVCAVAFSPDGSMLAAGDGNGRVDLWTASGDRLDALLEQGDGAVFAVAFTPDSSVLATGDSDGNIGLWDPSEATRLSMLPRPGGGGASVFALAFGQREPLERAESGRAARSERRRRDAARLVLAAGYSMGGACLWDAERGRLLTVLGKPHPGAVLAVAFSTGDKLLATGHPYGMVALWDGASGRPVAAI